MLYRPKHYDISKCIFTFYKHTIRTPRRVMTSTPTNITIKEGPSYLTNVYYDILDDDCCLWTIYRFNTKEIAENFINEVPFVCTDITYDTKPRGDDGHLDTHPFRPIFFTLEDALVDAKEFEKYGDAEEYQYSGRVFTVDLSECENQHYKNTIRKLNKENAELKSKVALLEAELKSVKLLL
jgi:hypothetical protein